LRSMILVTVEMNFSCMHWDSYNYKVSGFPSNEFVTGSSPSTCWGTCMLHNWSYIYGSLSKSSLSSQTRDVPPFFHLHLPDGFSSQRRLRRASIIRYFSKLPQPQHSIFGIIVTRVIGVIGSHALLGWLKMDYCNWAQGNWTLNTRCFTLYAKQVHPLIYIYTFSSMAGI
jgi:hypothetical protein